MRSLLTVARCRSKRLGRAFTVKESDLLPLPSVCPVLGIPLNQGTGRRDDNARSLDRKNNALGYTPENTEIISYRANRLKSDATPDESLAIAYYQAESLDLLGLKELSHGGR